MKRGVRSRVKGRKTNSSAISTSGLLLWSFDWFWCIVPEHGGRDRKIIVVSYWTLQWIIYLRAEPSRALECGNRTSYYGLRWICVYLSYWIFDFLIEGGERVKRRSSKRIESGSIPRENHCVQLNCQLTPINAAFIYYWTWVFMYDTDDRLPCGILRLRETENQRSRFNTRTCVLRSGENKVSLPGGSLRVSHQFCTVSSSHLRDSTGTLLIFLFFISFFYRSRRLLRRWIVQKWNYLKTSRLSSSVSETEMKSSQVKLIKVEIIKKYQIILMGWSY